MAEAKIETGNRNPMCLKVLNTQVVRCKILFQRNLTQKIKLAAPFLVNDLNVET